MSSVCVHVLCISVCHSRACLWVQADKDMELQALWKYCALSGEELKPPTVACDLGR